MNKIYFSTKKTAMELGLSLGTVQKLFDENELLGWKTKGGHRRVLAESVSNYKKNHGFTQKHLTSDKNKIIFIDINPEIICHIKKIASPICSDFEFHEEKSMVHFVFNLTKLNPSIVFINIDSITIEKYQLIGLLKNEHLSKRISVIGVTCNENSPGIHIDLRNDSFKKLKIPLDSPWLNGYLQGLISDTDSDEYNFCFGEPKEEVQHNLTIDGTPLRVF